MNVLSDQPCRIVDARNAPCQCVWSNWNFLLRVGMLLTAVAAERLILSNFVNHFLRILSIPDIHDFSLSAGTEGTFIILASAGQCELVRSGSDNGENR